MANVIQCDVCENICKQGEAMLLTIQELDTLYKAGCVVGRFHLCPECHEKVKKFIKGE
jgi:predicted PP-loop superfamily ATPase